MRVLKDILAIDSSPWMHTKVRPGILCKQVKFETELQDVRSKVERIVGELAVGPKGSTGINRALLSHIDALAVFLGRR